jgi:hypothetical protein
VRPAHAEQRVAEPLPRECVRREQLRCLLEAHRSIRKLLGAEQLVRFRNERIRRHLRHMVAVHAGPTLVQAGMLQPRWLLELELT